PPRHSARPARQAARPAPPRGARARTRHRRPVAAPAGPRRHRKDPLMLRLVNIIVIGALVVAAAWVYEIKYSSTRQAERVAKLRGEIRRERDAIAALRAEWAQLDNPDRIQNLAKRHLTLKPIEPTQFDTLDHLPEKPVAIVPP